MKCLHCLTDFFPERHEEQVGFRQPPQTFPAPDKQSQTAFFAFTTATCPNCNGGHIALTMSSGSGAIIQPTRWIYPRAGAYPPPPAQVPAPIAADYRESNEVLPISAKASAALSRRCLQAVLTAAGYNDRNLADQVQKAIDETSAAKALPIALRDSLDAIRSFGNFSAHPITDQTTLQIIDVEPGEAEWCLELLGEMFDHYYVRPSLAAERRAALAEKLSSAGKPPMKQGADALESSNLVKDGVDNGAEGE